MPSVVLELFYANRERERERERQTWRNTVSIDSNPKGYRYGDLQEHHLRLGRRQGLLG
jgi:hypothetical protein